MLKGPPWCGAASWRWTLCIWRFVKSLVISAGLTEEDGGAAKGKKIMDMGAGWYGGAKGESGGFGKDMVNGKVGREPNRVWSGDQLPQMEFAWECDAHDWISWRSEVGVSHICLGGMICS